MSGLVRRAASRPLIVSLSLGHGAADLCSGALMALLPVLCVERHYSYLAAAGFALSASLANAFFQPMAGLHGDRSDAGWLLPLGLVLAGLGMSLVGLTSSYLLTSLAAILCTAGVAAYHPEAARWTRTVSGGNRVTANMSIFWMGGAVGCALGPLWVAVVFAPLGLHGTQIIATLPLGAAALAAAVLLRFCCRPPDERSPERQTVGSAPEWRPFVLLAIQFTLVSGVATGLLTFVPLFLLQRHISPTASSVMTGALLAAAACGTLLGGIAAARFGRRPVLILPHLILAPAIALLPSLGWGSMVPAVAVIGLSMNANISVTLVLAQEFLPTRMGLATGLIVGVCGGAGALIVAALGILGDVAGLRPVLYVTAMLPLVSAVLAARLPRPVAAPPTMVWNLQLKPER